MKLNTKGLTLLEMMVALVILGIIVQVMLSMFTTSLKLTRKLRLQQEAAAAAMHQPSVVNLAAANEQASGHALICLTAGQAFPCDSKHSCEFVAGSWKRQNQVCDNGVLYTRN